MFMPLAMFDSTGGYIFQNTKQLPTPPSPTSRHSFGKKSFLFKHKFVFITHLSFNIEQYDSLLQVPVIWGDFAEGRIKQGYVSVNRL